MDGRGWADASAARAEHDPVLLSTLAAMVLVIAFLTGWPVYAMDVLGGAKAFGYYAFGLAAAGAVAACWVAFAPRRFDGVLAEPLLWTLAFTLLAGTVWRAVSPGDPDALEQIWRLRLSALLLFGSLLVLAQSARPGWMGAGIAVSLAVNVVALWIDLWNPGLVIPLDLPIANPGRGAAFHLNANLAGAAVVVCGIALMPFVPMRLRAMVVGAMAVGVVATFSRSSFIILVLYVAFALRHGLLDRAQGLLLAATVPVIAAALLSAYLVLLTMPDVNAGNLLGRLDWFSSFGREVDDSAGSRLLAARMAWDKFAASPWLGQGYGATLREVDSLTPHNMYLMMAAEQGVVGLAIYLAWLVTLARRGLSLMRQPGCREFGLSMLALTGFVVVQGLFNHNLLENPVLFAALPVLLSVAPAGGGLRPWGSRRGATGSSA